MRWLFYYRKYAARGIEGAPLNSGPSGFPGCLFIGLYPHLPSVDPIKSVVLSVSE